MLAVSECVARAALLRQESRGGHTRDDYPTMDPQWRQTQPHLLGRRATASRVEEQPMPAMRDDLLALFETDELAKYLTPEEMAADRRRHAATRQDGSGS